MTYFLTAIIVFLFIGWTSWDTRENTNPVFWTGSVFLSILWPILLMLVLWDILKLIGERK